MTVFDATFNVVDTNVEVREHDGKPHHLQVSLTVAQAIPTPNGLVGIPIGVVRFMLDKDDAQEHAKEVALAAEQLPDPSNLFVASDMGSVSHMADEMHKVTGS